MKCLIISNSSSGLYNFRKMLLEKLMEFSEVYAVTPFDSKAHLLTDLGVKLNEIHIDRRGLNPIKDSFLLLRIAKHIKKVSPDYIITYTIKPNIYGGFLARCFRIPYAANITGLGSVFQNDNLLKRVIVKLYIISLKSARVVFFENRNNMSVFLDNNIINKSQACLLNGAGVDLKKFKYLDYPKTIQPFVFLFIGRVMKEKGVEELFAAAKKLYESGYNIKLNVVGGCEEDYSNRIKDYERDGWLSYYGYQENVIPFIRDCHCFVLPSWHEGMANTNLECAASGRPLITTDIPGCREALINHVTGLLCNPKDTDDLMNKMIEIVNLSFNDRVKMGKAGRSLMETTFDKRLVVDKTIEYLGIEI